MSELAISSTQWLAISLRNGNAIVFNLNKTNQWQFLKSVENVKVPQENSSEDDDNLNRNLVKFTPDGQRLAVNGQNKQIYVYRTLNNEQENACWVLERVINVKKRASALDLTDEVLLIADKSGDVYKVDISIDDQNNETTLTGDDCLMGHLSMLLDIVFIRIDDDQSLILTADRDEKIRLSHYPNAYNIQGYCLGHTEFVSHVKLLDNNEILSASGDGTLRVWQLPNCKLLNVFHSEDLISSAKRRFYPSPSSIDENDQSLTSDISPIDVSIWKVDVFSSDLIYVALSIYVSRMNSIYLSTFNRTSQSLDHSYQLVFDSHHGEIIDYCFSPSKRSCDLYILFDNHQLIYVNVDSLFNSDAIVCSDDHLREINQILSKDEFHPINRCQTNLMIFKQLFKNRTSPGDCSYYKRKNERLLQTEEKRRKHESSTS